MLPESSLHSSFLLDLESQSIKIGSREIALRTKRQSIEATVLVADTLLGFCTDENNTLRPLHQLAEEFTKNGFTPEAIRELRRFLETGAQVANKRPETKEALLFVRDIMGDIYFTLNSPAKVDFSPEVLQSNFYVHLKTKQNKRPGWRIVPGGLDDDV